MDLHSTFGAGRRRRSWLLIASLASLAAGCSGAPPPPPKAAHVEPPAPAPPPLPPSRWVETGGATAVGPALAEGTLVLLAGRRALVGKDGAMHTEKAPSPEALQEIITVPTASGQRLIARGTDTIYRLDDPLGPPRPLVRLDHSISRFGAGPSVIAVWTSRSDLPTFLDVETGKPKPLASLPEPPLRAIAFLDQKRGAAVFEAAGLAVTSDGGASWKLTADPGGNESLRMNGLRRRGDALRAFAYADGPDAAIDIDAIRVSTLEQPQPSSNEAPLLRWIRLTGRDPLDAAVSGGIEMATGGALVASHGLLGRVDTKTGALLDLTEFARGKWMNPCATARSGGSALVACTLSEEQAGADLFDPFGVFSVSLSGPALKADKPSLVRNGDVELVAAPSGGAMLLGACSSDGDASACVRQADGKWLPVHAEIDLNGRGAGPTADGKVAVLRGLVDGDDASEPDQGAAVAAPSHGAGDEGDAPRARRLHVSLLDPSGKEQALPTFEVSSRVGEIQVFGTLEEGTDHALHFVIDGGDGLQAVIQPLTRDPATVQKIAGASTARIRAGRGIAVGEGGHVLASLDGGGSWSEVQAPPFAMEALSSFGTRATDWSQIEVSEIGVKFGSVLRVGWGPTEATPEPKPPPAAPRLELPKTQAPGPDKLLRCKSEGTAQGTPPLLGSAQIRQALANKTAAAKGTRRETSHYGLGRAGMLDTIALLEEEGPDTKGLSPARWTLKWQDPTELGAKPRSVSMPVFVPAAPAAAAAAAPSKGKPAASPAAPAPAKEIPWGASLRFAASSGARAIFSLRAGGKNILVRTKPGGGVEALEVTTNLVPSGEVVFGADKGEPIAWIHDNALVVWLAGEAPRALTAIPTHALRSLGQPAKDGIPVMLSATDWAIMRVVAIPPLDKKAAAAAAAAAATTATKPPPPTAPSLDGWTRMPNIRREIGALAACGAKPTKGPRFIIQRSALSAVVDGAGEAGSLALYDVRVGGGETCVAAISSLLTPDRRASQPAPTLAAGAAASAAAAAGKKKPAAADVTGPVAFVRADLLGKRAEGGDRGLAPGAAMRRLICSLGDKP